MPNWCYNKLKVSGFKNKMEQRLFKEQVRSKGIVGKDDEDICIEKLFPLPKELEGTQSPSNPISSPIEYALAKKEYDQAIAKDPNSYASKPITVAMSSQLKKKYGVDNWYDWNCANYGTKWGFAHSNLYKEGKSYLKYEFDTAWSQPEPAIEKMSALYPNLDFELRFVEEGMAFKGMCKFKNGEKIEDYEYNM